MVKKIVLGNNWYISDMYRVPEIWNGDELFGWYYEDNAHFVFHPKKEIPKKILTSFKLYCLNKALH